MVETKEISELTRSNRIAMLAHISTVTVMVFFMISDNLSNFPAGIGARRRDDAGRGRKFECNAGCKCNYAEAGNTGCPFIKENKQHWKSRQIISRW